MAGFGFGASDAKADSPNYVAMSKAYRFGELLSKMRRSVTHASCSEYKLMLLAKLSQAADLVESIKYLDYHIGAYAKTGAVNDGVISEHLRGLKEDLVLSQTPGKETMLYKVAMGLPLVASSAEVLPRMVASTVFAGTERLSEPPLSSVPPLGA